MGQSIPPAKFREKANEVRAMAKKFKDPALRSQAEQIARHWEELAVHAESLRPNSN